MQRRITLSVLVTLLAVAAAACGSDGDDAAVTGKDTTAIDIEMRDVAFSPSAITVPAGEEVRLVFRNTGKVDHDAFIGDEEAQADHAKDMKSDGGMHHGGDPDALTVAPGKTATLTRTFEAGEDVLIGCHQPGHYAGGMKVTVDVS